MSPRGNPCKGATEGSFKGGLRFGGFRVQALWGFGFRAGSLKNRARLMGISTPYMYFSESITEWVHIYYHHGIVPEAHPASVRNSSLHRPSWPYRHQCS